jgi:hypothetical protein
MMLWALSRPLGSDLGMSEAILGHISVPCSHIRQSLQERTGDDLRDPCKSDFIITLNQEIKIKFMVKSTSRLNSRPRPDPKGEI